MTLLNNKTHKALAKKLDKWINVGLLEPLDGVVISKILESLDRQFLNLIPEDPLRQEVVDLLEAYAKGDKPIQKDKVIKLVKDIAVYAEKSLSKEGFMLTSTGQGPKEERP